MPAFAAYDGTELAFQVHGEGSPVICVPGGPMQDPVYLGDLGGLSAHRQLIMLNLRGTGGSAIPRDLSSYRCDRLVDDVEALREHLGLDRMDLLAHSGGANLTVLYAARHPQRVHRLALITPSTMAAGVAVTGEARLQAARHRRDEPWFPAAYAALEAVTSGRAAGGDWEAIVPFWYGRWDAEAQAHHAAEDEQRNDEAAGAYAGEGAFTPDITRAALAAFGAPVLLLAGEADVAAPPPAMAAFAELFPNAKLVVQPKGGHFPWLDDAGQFVATTAAFLG
ncbi:alpha/beta fold hydrolase [Sphaerisporangium dianthi]|uniref:Alpha/beta fold hydrolase n=1 Tax=Sphaerisporangium dianthi TaxID=1436120 RepID=A0ABV9CCS8_9ACTN